MRCHALMIYALMLCPSLTHAAISTIALTGNPALGIDGSEFYSFGLPSINASGALAFSATLESGVGGVTSDNDRTVYKVDQNNFILLAREGTNPPAPANATFSDFFGVAIDDVGNVLIRGEMLQGGTITASNNQALWRYSNGGNSLLARTGTSSVPGVSSSNGFNNLPLEGTLLAGNGRAAFLSSLVLGGSISNNNDRGIWSYDGITGAMISRESITPAPDVVLGTFVSFLEPVVNDNHQVAFMGVLSLGGNITTANRHGIWKYTQGVGELITRTGQDVPGVSGVSFLALLRPSINNSDQIAFQATLTSNETPGIWLFTENQGELIALAGAGGAPGAPDAQFAAFTNPSLSDTGDVFFRASLQLNVGGVNSSNQTGLWRMRATEGEMLFRTGSGNVPGLTDAHFADFTTMAVNEVGSLVVSATLAHGIGGVTSENDEGIWFIDADGNKSLIAREGSLLAGKTISSLSFTGNSSGSDGQRTGFNTLDQLIFRATFTDGDSGIFLYSPTTTFFATSDFNEDGYVDETDLAWWRDAYGISNLGDADGDGDSDGVDFLTWQRQYTGPPGYASQMAVPEPSVWCLLGLAFCFSPCRNTSHITRG